MGGLAAREYIQNQSNWQSDGNHHVAKLLTIGTPHGGSDAGVNNPNSSSIIEAIKGQDIKSESSRDFCKTPGIFLFGGRETDNTAFYNNDVNCDGNSTSIFGLNNLNKKPFPSDIAVSNIYGINMFNVLYPCAGNLGDWLVCADDADMNKVLGIYSDVFKIDRNINPILKYNKAYHSYLQKNETNFPVIIQGLDEPKTYDKAYDVPLNYGYYGNVTIQAENDPYPEPQKSTDYDDYRITLPQNGSLRLLCFNLPVPNFTAYIVDANYRVLKSFSSDSRCNIDGNITLTKGTYYIEIEARPTYDSWKYPYGFATLFTPTAGAAADFAVSTRSGCSPLTVGFTNQSTNATSYLWTFEGGTPSTSTIASPSVQFRSAGTYRVTLKATGTQGSISSEKVTYINVGSSPTASFNFAIDTSSVRFLNLTNEGVYANYSWNFGDATATSSEKSPVHTYMRTGTYYVTLTATNNCGANASQKLVQITRTTPTIDVDLSKTMQLYPNPTSENLTLLLSEIPSSTLSLKITDMLGQIVHQQSITETSTPINISTLSSGMYIALSIEQTNSKIIQSQKANY
jgi:PKD repeat protein